MASARPNTSDEIEKNEFEASTDYTQYGITGIPKTTMATPLGKTKTVAGLSAKEWAFLIISFVNIVTAAALTTVRLVQVVKDDPKSSDFTFTILLLINGAFCLYYVIHGVLRERTYELYAFMAAILVVLMYCVLEYSVFNPSHRTTIKLVRLVLACVMAPPNIILAWYVSRGFGYLEFHIVGASEFLQRLYSDAAIFSCLLKFDLQASSSLVVLVLKNGTSVSLLDTVSLAVGMPFSILWCIFGWIVLRKEIKIGAAVFAVIGVIKPVYDLYKVVMAYQDIDETEPNRTITYSLLFASAIALIVWCLLMYELSVVYKNFDKGLKKCIKDVLTTETSGLLHNRT